MMNFSKSLCAFLILVTLSFLVTNCKKKEEEEKKPLADFITDKSEYFAGEVIHLINNSSDGDTYRWTMPDGQTVKTENADYTSDALMGSGTLSFKLEAFSKNGTKSDYSVKVIKVKPSVGQIILYAGQFVLNADITIDGKSEGTVTFPNNNTIPTECGEAGYPTFTLIAGPHIIVGTRGPYNYTLKVDIAANKCTIAKLD